MKQDKVFFFDKYPQNNRKIERSLLFQINKFIGMYRCNTYALNHIIFLTAGFVNRPWDIHEIMVYR